MIISRIGFTPKVILSGFFIKQGKVGGTENQFYNLAVGLVKAGAHVTIACYDQHQLSSSFKAQVNEIEELSVEYFDFRKPRFIADQQLIFSIQNSFDAVIYTNYFTPFVTRKKLVKIATVLHDCQYRHLPQYFPAHKRVWLNIAHRNTMRRADRIIVLSKSVFEDIERFYGRRNMDKVSVIGNPISWSRFDLNSKRNYKTPKKYVLSVAHQFPHKNLDTLIRAWEIVKKIETDVKLVLAGQLAENLSGRIKQGTNLSSLVRELQLENSVLFTGFIEDWELGQLYSNASIFAFPSLFEGFGLPPVEAMGLGIPTITSYSTCLPEVTFGLAEYVQNPLSKIEWAEKIIETLRQSRRPDQTTIAEKIKEAYDLRNIGEKYLNAIFSSG